jgi:hypothetical protein
MPGWAACSTANHLVRPLSPKSTRMGPVVALSPHGLSPAGVGDVYAMQPGLCLDLLRQNRDTAALEAVSEPNLIA